MIKNTTGLKATSSAHLQLFKNYILKEMMGHFPHVGHQYNPRGHVGDHNPHKDMKSAPETYEAFNSAEP